MNDAADQIVSMSLKGIQSGAEMTLRLTGLLAKNIGTFLYAVLTGAKQVKGRASLVKMLKTGKELKTFSIRTDDLKLFVEKAKERGVLFHVIKDLNPTDGISEIMTTSDHARTVAGIAERFKLASVRETATIQSDYKEKPDSEKSDPAVNPQDKQENTKDTPADKSAQDFEAFLNEKFAGTMDVKEVPKSEQPNSENPTLAAKSPPQHPSKTSSEKAEHGGTNSDSRPSIRGELKNIKEETRINPDKSPRGKNKGSKQKTTGAQNKPPKQKPKAR